MGLIVMTGRGPDPTSTNSHDFETERLHVDVPTSGDASQLYALLSGDLRQQICATLLWDGPEDLAEVEEWVEDCRTESYEDRGFHWVIRDRVGAVGAGAGQVLGAIGTRPREVPGRADVGYWLGRPYWGSGLMTEALSGLLDYCFTSLDVHKVEADVFTHNLRGRHVVEKVGMTQEGVIRHAHRKGGEWVDHVVYGILADEWTGP